MTLLVYPCLSCSPVSCEMGCVCVCMRLRSPVCALKCSYRSVCSKARDWLLVLPITLYPIWGLTVSLSHCGQPGSPANQGIFLSPPQGVQVCASVPLCHVSAGDLNRAPSSCFCGGHLGSLSHLSSPSFPFIMLTNPISSFCLSQFFYLRIIDIWR
jgi:hypothetical protein